MNAILTRSKPVSAEVLKQVQDLIAGLGGLSYRALSVKRYTMEFEAKLNAAGVFPFTTESVEKYKNMMLWKVNVWQNWRAYVPFVLGATAFTLMSQLVPEVTIGRWFVGAISFLAGLIPLAHYDAFNWRKDGLPDYGGEIPVEVLVRANVLKATLDKGREKNPHYRDHYAFHVLSLTDKWEVVDPFLIVRDRDSGAEFYIDVWDEPGFKLGE